MSYRDDARCRCPGCRAAMPEGEGLFTKSGYLVCRMCANSALIAETERHIAETGAPAWGADRPESRSGYWALGPVALFCFWSLAQLAEDYLSPRSCSELACLGLVLVPMPGIVGALPCTIVAVMRVPARARRRVAFAGFGAMLLMLGTFVAQS